MKQGSMAANLVATRGNRCSASILGWMETNVYPKYPEMSTQTQKQIRQMILDNVNSFKDLSIDIVKSETSVLNDVWVSKLDEIHQEIRKNAK